MDKTYIIALITLIVAIVTLVVIIMGFSYKGFADKRTCKQKEQEMAEQAERLARWAQAEAFKVLLAALNVEALANVAFTYAFNNRGAVGYIYHESGSDIYGGEEKNGKLEGYGVYKNTRRGYIMSGEYIDWQVNGYVMEKWLWGEYCGEYHAEKWYRSSCEGVYGFHCYSNESTYAGELCLKAHDNNPNGWTRYYNGKGVFTYADRSYYAGEWKMDKKDGYGIMYDSYGNEFQKGKWENDKFIEN